MPPEPPDRYAVYSFLSDRFTGIDQLDLLQAGGWATAYSFRTEDHELIVRFGVHHEDFDKEQVASTWTAPDLPVPKFFEAGRAFDGFYIVSQRFYGETLGKVEASRTPAVVDNLFDILSAIRAVALPGRGYGIWLAPACDAPSTSWADYLTSARDRDESRLVNWKRSLRARPDAYNAFQRGCDAIDVVAPTLPNLRSVGHADLLLNHLIAPDNSITAVFDWGNALAGDPLYDVAWIL